MDCARCLMLREDGACHAVPPYLRPVVDAMRAMPLAICDMYTTVMDLDVVAEAAAVAAAAERDQMRCRRPHGPSTATDAATSWRHPNCPTPTTAAENTTSASPVQATGLVSRRTRGRIGRTIVTRLYRWLSADYWQHGVALACITFAVGLIVLLRVAK